MNPTAKEGLDIRMKRMGMKFEELNAEFELLTKLIDVLGDVVEKGGG